MEDHKDLRYMVQQAGLLAKAMEERKELQDAKPGGVFQELGDLVRGEE